MKTKQIYSLRQDLKQGYGSEIIEENRGDPQSFCILSRPLMKPIFIMIKSQIKGKCLFGDLQASESSPQASSLP